MFSLKVDSIPTITKKKSWMSSEIVKRLNPQSLVILGHFLTSYSKLGMDHVI